MSTSEQRKASFLALDPRARMQCFFGMSHDEQQEAQAWIDEANEPQKATVDTVPTEGVMLVPGVRVVVPLVFPDLAALTVRRGVELLRRRLDTEFPSHAVGRVVAGGRKCDDVEVWDTVWVAFGDALDPDSAIGPFRLSARVVEVLDPEQCPRLGRVEKARAT